MPQTSVRTEADPVSQAVAHSHLMAGHRPVPLVSTSYRIAIRGGLADVTAKRTFRNVEPQSIEATLTFPLPVHAVLYALRARIGDRNLSAKARARLDARADYEQAIDSGKTAILHEELIKGVHLLSVGHIAPNSDIEVTAQFALPLSHVSGRILLRIPTTVGQVYGTSGLQDCDELVSGGPLHTADIEIACDHGEVLLAGATLTAGRSSVALNRPIEIEVRNWTATAITGRSASGRHLTLKIVPDPEGTAAFDAAVLVDRSGSMGSICSVGSSASKHDVAIAALVDAAKELGERDRTRLIQFDDDAQEIGTASGAALANLVGQMSRPRGGTEIGRAIDFAISRSASRDILLVTDGKTHALDIQALARSERRFTVVLIGEDSLDANVGHLAVLTGGDIFVPVANEVKSGVTAALRSLRRTTAERRGTWVRGGMLIEVEERAEVSEVEAADAAVEHGIGRAAAAYAASLKMGALDTKSASALAEAEGLVTHLTSLIVVDEEGALQSGLPATRKVVLPAPAAAASMPAEYLREDAAMRRAPVVGASPMPTGGRPSFSFGRSAGRSAPVAKATKPRSPPVERSHDPRFSEQTPIGALIERFVRKPADLSEVRDQIDWALHGSQLSTGDFSCLDSRLGALILKASESTAVRKAAKRVKLHQVQIVIGVIAWCVRDKDRHAARVARALLGGLGDRHIEAIAHRLRLDIDKKAA